MLDDSLREDRRMVSRQCVGQRVVSTDSASRTLNDKGDKHKGALVRAVTDGASNELCLQRPCYTVYIEMAVLQCVIINGVSSANFV
jgi:hypothetical protein